MTTNELFPGTILIRLDTTQAVPAEQCLLVADAILLDLRRIDGVGEDTLIELVRLGRGSTLMEVVFTGLAAAAAVGSFALTFSEYLRSGRAHSTIPVARTINSYGGTQVIIMASGLDEPIIVPVSQMVPIPLSISGIEPKPPTKGRLSIDTGLPNPDRLDRLVLSRKVDDIGAAQSLREVTYVGSFEKRPDGGYLFRRDDDPEPFEVIEMHRAHELQTDTRFILKGILGIERDGQVEFNPAIIEPVSKT